MPTAREIETEAERQRAQLSDTLEALRDRMTPGEIVDQAMAFARGHGGGEFVQNLGAQVRSSPLPVALVATGLAWLMFAPRRTAAPAPSIVPEPSPYAGATPSTTRTAGYGTAHASDEIAGRTRDVAGATASAAQGTADKVRGAYGSIASGASGAAASAGDAAGRASGMASSAAESVRRGAHDLGDRAADLGHDAYDRAADLGQGAYARARAVGESVADQASHAQAGLMRIVREQPLVVGALGLALGALIGAAMPRSRTEDELMGEAADEMKQSASEAVRGYYGEAKDAAGRIADRVRDAAEEQGLTTGSAQGAAQGVAQNLRESARGLGDKASELGDKVAAVAEAAKESTREELDHAKEKLASDVDKAAGKDGSSKDLSGKSEPMRGTPQRDPVTAGAGGPGGAPGVGTAAAGTSATVSSPGSPVTLPAGGRPAQPGKRPS